MRNRYRLGIILALACALPATAGFSERLLRIFRRSPCLRDTSASVELARQSEPAKDGGPPKLVETAKAPLYFSDVDLAAEWASRAFAALNAKITSQQMAAIEIYRGPSHFEFINTFIRNGWEDTPADDPTVAAYFKQYEKFYKFTREQTTDTIRQLDSVFAMPEAKLEEDVVVWRGFGGNTFRAQEIRDIAQAIQDGTLEPGFMVRDPAYKSTSFKFEAARFRAGSNGFIMKVIVPKGTPVIAHNSMPGRSVEEEMILPRRYSYRFVRIEEHHFETRLTPTYALPNSEKVAVFELVEEPEAPAWPANYEVRSP